MRTPSAPALPGPGRPRPARGVDAFVPQPGTAQSSPLRSTSRGLLPEASAQAVSTSRLQAASTSRLQGLEADPETYSLGTEVTIQQYRFRCRSVLGQGSFSQVWLADAVAGSASREVALKDMSCKTESELQQAMLEVSLLARFQSAAQPQMKAFMRIPEFLAHRVDRRGNSWRVRMAMSRVPGEPLDQFLQRPPLPNQDGAASVHRGCNLAISLLRQLAPTLERIAPFAWHRDINSRNVMISDAIDGGVLWNGSDKEETTRRASFWLIDFGLAVDSQTWPQSWATADVAGDCRYWPPSSFCMSFYGAEGTAANKAFLNQYKTKLDVVGLGLTALELLCATALSSSWSWGPDDLRGSWRRLLAAWEKYREDVTRWHTLIYEVFSSGGDIHPLYRKLNQERVVDRVTAHIEHVRQLLRTCVGRTQDPMIQRLLQVLAEMIDENSTYTMAEVVAALGQDPGCVPAAAHQARPHYAGA